MRRSIRAHDEKGFSIIELVIVTGIMFIMAAVALPKIGRYFRNYQINSAVREVSGEIQAARNRAVMKNVNFGSVFYIRSNTTYRTALEDDQTPPRRYFAITITEAENTAAFPSQSSPLRRLPGDVQFGTGCLNTPAPNDTGIRFTRLGMACNPGTGTGECRLALENPAASPNFVYNDNTGGSSICLVQPSTGLRRLIRVSPGGRVSSREGQG